jgi:hypothetical protein
VIAMIAAVAPAANPARSKRIPCRLPPAKKTINLPRAKTIKIKNLGRATTKTRAETIAEINANKYGVRITQYSVFYKLDATPHSNFQTDSTPQT